MLLRAKLNCVSRFANLGPSRTSSGNSYSLSTSVCNFSVSAMWRFRSFIDLLIRISIVINCLICNSSAGNTSSLNCLTKPIHVSSKYCSSPVDSSNCFVISIQKVLMCNFCRNVLSFSCSSLDCMPI